MVLGSLGCQRSGDNSLSEKKIKLPILGEYPSRNPNPPLLSAGCPSCEGRSEGTEETGSFGGDGEKGGRETLDRRDVMGKGLERGKGLPEIKRGEECMQTAKVIPARFSASSHKPQMGGERRKILYLQWSHGCRPPN
jgi:hypothetical protein